MEFELVAYQVGEKFPDENVLRKMCSNQNGGASLVYTKEDKMLSLFIAIPNPNKTEIRAFTKDLVRFAFYPNHFLDTSLIMVCFGIDFIFELLYDINVLDMDMDGLVEGNRFDMFLIDSNTGILKGIRSLGLGKNFMERINQVVKSDGRYTSKEYNEWIQNDVYKKSIRQLWSESERMDWDK